MRLNAAIMAALDWPCNKFDQLRDWLEAVGKGRKRPKWDARYDEAAPITDNFTLVCKKCGSTQTYMQIKVGYSSASGERDTPTWVFAGCEACQDNHVSFDL